MRRVRAGGVRSRGGIWGRLDCLDVIRGGVLEKRPPRGDLEGGDVGEEDFARGHGRAPSGPWECGCGASQQRHGGYRRAPSLRLSCP